MRVPVLTAVAAMSLAVSACGATDPQAAPDAAGSPTASAGDAQPGAAPDLPASTGWTEVEVVRPVGPDGAPAPGWAVTARAELTVPGQDCAFPSPAAATDDVVSCGLPPDDLLACLPAADPHRVLCVRDPDTRTLVEVEAVAASVEAPAEPYPLAVELGDGAGCRLVTGGGPTGDTAGNYTCTDGRALFPTDDWFYRAGGDGWTVRAGHAADDAAEEPIVRAVFVGRAVRAATR